MCARDREAPAVATPGARGSKVLLTGAGVSMGELLTAQFHLCHPGCPQADPSGRFLRLGALRIKAAANNKRSPARTTSLALPYPPELTFAATRRASSGVRETVSA